MSDKDLKSKIFTFDKSLCGLEMDEMVGKDLGLEKVL